MTAWTDKQKEAIEDRGKTLLVTAAAGSGKTAVLVERIVNLVLYDRVEVDRLLVMTFTRAAASELKERVARRLEQALEDSGEEGFITEQLDRINGAQISTIHSFCSSLLQRYFNELSLDPGYRLLDGDEEKMLKEEVLHDVLEDFYREQTRWFRDLVDYFSGGRGDRQLRQTVLELDRFLEGIPAPEKWLDDQLEEWRKQAQDFSGSETAALLMKKAREAVSEAAEYFFLYQEMAHEDLTFYKSAVENDRDLLFRLRQVATETPSALFTELSCLKFASLKPKPRNFDGDPERVEQFQYYRKKMKDVLLELGKYAPASPEKTEKMAGTVYKVLKDLRTVLETFRKAARERREEENVLAFSDLEHYSLQLLENEQIRAEVRNTYEQVFVDEYQDTSSVQEAILHRISGEDNLFMVGDMKQSIYRFRQAAPEIFQKKKEDFQHNAGEYQKLLSLNRNFRCSDPIVQSVNYIFSRLMSRELGEIDYDDIEELRYGNVLDDETSPVSFYILDKEQEIADDSLYRDLDYMEREAMAAAEILKNQHGKIIYDHKQERHRELEWKDMAVILRTSKNWGDQYLEVLKKAGIPAYKDLPLGYFEVMEIKVLMNMLRLVDNTRQDYPWLSFLRSPVIGLSDEQLGRIRAACPDDSFLHALRYYHRGQDEPAGEKIDKALKFLSDWRSANRYLPLDHLVHRILRDSRWYALAGAMPGGEQRQANIRLFLSRAKQYGENNSGGLSGFLRWFDELEQQQSDPGVASTTGERANVVRIMSAHRSKGLEYPLVLIGALGKQFNLTDASEPVLAHKERGLGPKYVSLEKKVAVPTTRRLLIRDSLLRENLSEELRILYVAATRARNRLIFLGGLKLSQLESLRYSNPAGKVEGKSWGDWLYPILAQKLPPFMNLIFWSEDVKEELKHEKTKRRAQRKQPFLEKLNEQPARPLYPDRRKEERQKDRIASTMPSKLAVTDLERLGSQSLLHGIPGREAVREKPRFLESTGKKSGSERGLALHQVMQHLNLQAGLSKDEIKGQVEKMQEREMITQEEAGLVDAGLIAEFFRQPLGKRLLNSEWEKREIPFNLKMDAGRIFPEARFLEEEILVQGVIDLVFAEREGLVLVDYKTDSPGNVEMHREKYRKQLAVYREALERILRQPVRQVYLYLFSAQKAIEMEE